MNIKTVLFQTIQFSISTQFCSIWPKDRTLSGASTLGQSGSGRDGNKEVIRIPQSPNITRTSPSDCLVSYPGHSLRERSYPLAVMQLVYSAASAKWARKCLNKNNKIRTSSETLSTNFLISDNNFLDCFLFLFWFFFALWSYFLGRFKVNGSYQQHQLLFFKIVSF